MADLLGLGVRQHRPVTGGDFLQRPADAGRVARELHGRGVGQEFAAARNRRLDDPGAQHADETDHEQGKAGADQEGRALAIAPAAYAHHAAADERDQQDTVQQTGQAQVEAHVAVEDVAELVRDHALQLVAGQRVECSLGNGNGRIRRRVTGGEGIDAGLAFHHEDCGHRNAGGDGHFLDHVDETLARRIGGVGLNRHRADRTRHLRATTGQRHHFVQAAAADQQQGDRGRGGEQSGLGRPPAVEAGLGCVG